LFFTKETTVIDPRLETLPVVLPHVTILVEDDTNKYTVAHAIVQKANQTLLREGNYQIVVVCKEYKR
jgi:hypothetical protein